MGQAIEETTPWGDKGDNIIVWQLGCCDTCPLFFDNDERIVQVLLSVQNKRMCTTVLYYSIS